MEPVELVLKNIYQSNTYRKDLSWPHFDNEPRVPEKQQVKGQQSCVFVFVGCLTITSSNYGHQPRRDNSIPYMGVWYIYRTDLSIFIRPVIRNQPSFLRTEINKPLLTLVYSRSDSSSEANSS